MSANEIVIVDNFLEDPSSVRDFALAQEYQKESAFPGLRTINPFFNDDLKKKIEDILKVEISPANSRNGCYQVILQAQFKDSYVHSDGCRWSGIICLSEDSEGLPGTSFFMHKKTKKHYYEEHLSHHYIRDRLDQDKWEITETTALKFNRLIMYPGNRFHMNGSAWGSSVADGRLTQVFFLD